MAPQSRKRRAPTERDETPASEPRNRRRAASEEDDEIDFGELVEEQHQGSGRIAELSKKLVRYALSCEYARVPIKRQDVSQKVLGSYSRSFRAVFEAANGQLLDVFGMEMVELPNREKATIRQKRTAAASESQAKTSQQWVLREALPARFRIPAIMGPPLLPNEEDEATYLSLYTMIISLIKFSGGVLSEGKLERFLKRMNAEVNTPIGSTEEVLKRMTKDGYIAKVKDTSSGEEVTDYHVGPRGKVEVDDEAIKDFARTVYAANPIDDLEQRLARSLKGAQTGEVQRAGGGAVGDGDGDADGDADGAAQGGGRSQQRGPGRPRRRREESDSDSDE